VDVSAFRTEAEALSTVLTGWRRDFHQHPELGFHEHRTAGVIANVLTDLGLEIRTGIAETGVVAVLEGVRPGPTILLRFDMDALPIQEATGAPYASEQPGVMHACGHDGHVAIGLGTARLLQRHQSELAGRAMFVFQPAEEGLGGAARMIAEGALEAPRPDRALGMHLWNTRPVGWISAPPGAIMAAADILEITIRGRGGHGAAPHQAIDPIVAAAHVVTALQSIVARNLDPRATAVVSVTQITAGEAFNVIPSQALLRGTIRTFEPEVRERILIRIEAIARGIAEAMGCRAVVEVRSLTPAVVNAAAVAARIAELARCLHPEGEVDDRERSTVSEDMACFLQAVPGAFVLIGSGNTARGLDAPHHSPMFDFDERALPQAVALLAATTWDLLERP
jgi:amidohydrolase